MVLGNHFQNLNVSDSIGFVYFKLLIIILKKYWTIWYALFYLKFYIAKFKWYCFLSNIALDMEPKALGSFLFRGLLSNYFYFENWNYILIDQNYIIFDW